MNNLGDFLYQLTPRDAQALGMEYVQEERTVALLSTTVSTNFRVPAEKAFYMQSIIGRTVAGGAQLTNFFEVLIRNRIDPINTGEVALILQQSGSGEDFLIPSGNIYLIPPNHEIIFKGTFSAGAVANSVRAGVTGWFIPRGNLAQASFAP